MAGAGAVLVVAVASGVLATAAGNADPHDAALVLDSLSGFAALAAYALCVFRWRLGGESTALWAGTGALAAGLSVVAGPRAPALQQAAQLATLAFLAASALAPPVDTRLRPGRLTAAAGAAVAVLSGAFALVPSLGRRVAVEGVAESGPVAAVAGLAMAAAWVTVAVIVAWRSFRRRWLYGWAGVLAFALVLAQLAGAVSGTGWDVAARSIRLVGLLVAVLGCAVELGRGFVEQRSRLFDSELSLEASAVQQRAQRASRRVQRHAVRNAATAVEGAAVTLERHLDRLSPADRASLTEMLTAGVDRLQRLLHDERVTETTFELAPMVTGVVRERGWAERAVVAVPDGLAACGSAPQTAEVLRVLLDNADQRAPGQPVTLTAGVETEWVVLRVHDRGPALSRQRRRALFRGDDQRTEAEGGLSVLVAGRIMQEMGGDLWVQATAGEGATFALCLPVPAGRSDAATVDAS